VSGTTAALKSLSAYKNPCSYITPLQQDTVSSINLTILLNECKTKLLVGLEFLSTYHYQPGPSSQKITPKRYKIGLLFTSTVMLQYLGNVVRVTTTSSSDRRSCTAFRLFANKDLEKR